MDRLRGAPVWEPGSNFRSIVKCLVKGLELHTMEQDVLSLQCLFYFVLARKTFHFFGLVLNFCNDMASCRSDVCGGLNMKM